MKANGVTHLESEKFNIAWFKLAEFVARKEKERALGMYRLLAHSIADGAVAAQLEGDLLLAFNDSRALASYLRAAELYEKEGKLLQAIAVSEHCSLLAPEALECTVRLSHLYEKIGEPKKAGEYALRVVEALLSKGPIEQVLSYCVKASLSLENQLTLLEQLALEFLSHTPSSRENINRVLDVMVQRFIQLRNSKRLTAWLTLLTSTDLEAYEYCRRSLKHC